MIGELSLLGLDSAQLAVVAAIVVAGALVQGTIGIGFGIVLVPGLTLLAPASVPATPLLLALPLTVLIAHRERSAIDRQGLPVLLVGRILGTIAAVVLLIWLTESALEILFGLVILGVIPLSLASPDIPFTRTNQLAAGATSGLFATTAAIGGPPAALLYQRRPGPELRATLGALFLVGGLISIIGLLAAQRLAVDHLALALVLAPAMVIGFALSRPLARVLDARWLRPAVLTFAGAAGALAVLRGVLGLL